MLSMPLGSVTFASFQHCINKLSPSVTVLLLEAKAALFNSWQLIKAPGPTFTTLAGRAIDSSFWQLRKAFPPMDSTPLETVTEVRLKQSRKASSQMVFTLEGIVTEMMEEPLNAWLLIVVTLLGMDTLSALVS